VLPRTFFKSVLDALVEQLAVIDSIGKIVFVNQRWRTFGIENGGDAKFEWEGISYLECCITSAQCGDDDARIVSEGIHDLLSGKQQVFTHEYPCHSSEIQRWFLMRMAPVKIGTQSFFVITHQNITERKLAEEALADVATKDPLTDIANRRKFEEFSAQHWKLGIRRQSVVSIAMIDIDLFKAINDRFGHAFGDRCLVELAHILASVTRRPNDLCARYGGEEFIVFLGDTSLSDAVKVSMSIIDKLRHLAFTDAGDGEPPYLSVSIGVASATPSLKNSLDDLIQEADANLYQAKHDGRDRVAFTHQKPRNESG
jgi:diguanylate cyclase (GGDEF)-like protein